MYKIEDGEWQNYEDASIRIEYGQTIYVKGIDKNGEETPINSYKAVLPDDALGVDAYDGKENTCYQIVKDGSYIEVNEDMVGKNYYIKVDGASYYFSASVEYYNSENEKISTSTVMGSGTFTIPANTKRIKLVKNYYGIFYIYEIRPAT